MENSLLLVSAKPEDQAFAAAVAKQAELPLRVVGDLHKGIAYFADNEPRVLFLDAPNEGQFHEIENLIQEKLGLFSDKVNPNLIHIISSEPLEKTAYITESPIFGNFVARNYVNAAEAGERYGYIVKATLGERAFGLEKLLRPQTKIQTVRFQRAGQKQDGVEAVKHFFAAAKFQARMATLMANAIDELLMNAMFDAPVDEVGRPLFNNLARTTEMDLKGRQEVQLRIGFDGTHVGVSVIDSFGSVDKGKLIAHISKIYTDKEYKLKSTGAGAGLGLATIFQQGASLFFVSEKDTKTEVTVFFKHCESFREFKDQFHFLSTQFYL